jgi:hypothetical protein
MKVPERPTISDKDVSSFLSELFALKTGDVSAHLRLECSSLPGKFYEAFNDLIEPRARLARRHQAAGEQWKFKRRSSLGEVRGFGKGVERDQLSSDLRGWLQR